MSYFRAGSEDLKVVFDESVSEGQQARFEVFAKEKKLKISDRIYVRERHPGMPDALILHHLLNKHTVLVTTDRPFHNKVLSKGLKSCFVGKKTVTLKPLRGIYFKHDVCLTKGDLVLKERYHPPGTEIRSLLLPESEKKLKRLHTARRRIRNHFGGLDHLDRIAVTVSWTSMGPKALMGVKIRVSSNVGIRALDAGESYVADVVESKDRGIISLCYALIVLIRLLLHSVPTDIFYDTHAIDDPNTRNVSATDSSAAFFDALRTSFPTLEFIPCPKGNLIERLRFKLRDLATSKKTNEVVQGNIAEMTNKVLEHVSEQKRIEAGLSPDAVEKQG